MLGTSCRIVLLAPGSCVHCWSLEATVWYLNVGLGSPLGHCSTKYLLSYVLCGWDSEGEPGTHRMSGTWHT